MPPAQGTWNPIEGPGDYTTTSTVHSDVYDAINPTKADLTGKTVFINGASKNLGRQTALAFARAGASHIIISARSDLSKVVQDLKEAAAGAGRSEPVVLPLKVEVSVPESVRAAVKEIETKIGKLDILVNNAAVMGSMSKIGDYDDEEWWNTMAVNVRGPMLMSKACLPLLLKGESKTIVNISSVGALKTNAALSAYQMSKTAVTRLTDFLAVEYADQGLIAFCVHPGNILTDMVDGDSLDDAWKAVFTESPQLCGNTLVYLTQERRQWLSGRYVNCTWDMSELTSPEMEKKIVDGDYLKLTLKTF